MTELIPRVSIIIPVLHFKRPKNIRYFYAKKYTLEEVINDLKANVEIDHEVIVICNSQELELVEYVKECSCVHKYCINSANAGVARSWNMGAQLAEGQALCFLNDDVRVGANAVEALFKHLFSDEEIGIVGPKGARWKGAEHDRFVGENTVEEADAISGFMFLIKSDLFRSLGGFDVKFTPAGFEEIDMSYRIQRAGKRCLVIPHLDVHHYHQHGVSAANVNIQYFDHSVSANDLHQRNMAYFKQKWKIDDV